MTKNNIKIELTYHGKLATTEFEVGGGLILEAITMKRYGGNTATTFQIWKIINQNSRETALDFRTHFIDHGKVRLTEKKLIELHNQAINNKDLLTKNFIAVEKTKHKSIACSKVLQLMDNDFKYQDALKAVLAEDASLNKQALETELNNYI